MLLKRDFWDIGNQTRGTRHRRNRFAVSSDEIMEPKYNSLLFYLYYSAVVFRHGLREANCVSRDKSRNRKEKGRPHFYHKSSYSRVLPTFTTDLCCAFSPLFPYPLSSPRSDVGFSPPSVSFREHDSEEERGRTSAVLFLCCLYTILFLTGFVT